MDTASYTFAALARKYDNFIAPAFELTIGHETFDSSTLPITHLEVEQTAAGKAGGCSFTVGGQYDLQTSAWKGKLFQAIQVGAKLAVKGGYVKKKELFYGYIDDYTLEYQEGSPPAISVNGIDGLGYLMNLRDKLTAEQRETAQFVKESLQKSITAGCAKRATIGRLTGFSAPLVKESESSEWEFLQEIARQYGMTLFALNGELIFDDVLANTSPILTLSVGMGLRSFSKRISLDGQIGQYEVRGRDENENPIQATATQVTVGGSGQSAAQLAPSIRQAVQREENEYVRTEAECRKLAQNRMNRIAMGLVSGSGTCIGLPELIPGRFLKIDGLDSGTSGLYFLSTVRHSFSDGGYTVSFEVQGAKE